MKIYCIDAQGFSSNTYILESNGEAFIFDPGVNENDIFKAIDRIGALPKGIILTHGHFDHILKLTEVREKYAVPVYIHESDAEMLTDSAKNAGSFFFDGDFVFDKAEHTFKDGDTLMLGGEEIKVLHTPGHTKGSCCFLFGKTMISGDTVFARGFGRYDLYGGDGSVLFGTLKSFRALDEDITVYPGHGESARLDVALENIGI